MLEDIEKGGYKDIEGLKTSMGSRSVGWASRKSLDDTEHDNT